MGRVPRVAEQIRARSQGQRSLLHPRNQPSTGNNGNVLSRFAQERTETMSTIDAEPFPLEFDAATTALMIIDMQRDFVLPGGFGEKLGNDTSLLLAAVEPTQRVLEAARKKKMFVIHTREGHRPDLSDCPPAKLTRGGATFIGTQGPMGRILVRGEQGHDIINQLYPIAGEPVI